MSKPLISSSFELAFTISLIAALSLSAGGCRQTKTPPAPIAAPDASTYTKEIEKWQSDRVATLTKQDGWLSLIGLYWLKEGENKFGSSAANPIRLPKDRAPLVAGSLWLEKGQVRMTAHPAVQITASGTPVTSQSPLYRSTHLARLSVRVAFLFGGNRRRSS